MSGWLILPFIAFFLFSAWMGIRIVDRRRGKPTKSGLETTVVLMLISLGLLAFGVIKEQWISAAVGALAFVVSSARHYSEKS
jgi:hypothetical protein